MSDDGKTNPEKSGKHPPFAPGNPGGPGRPKGSRNKLGEAFLEDLYANWQKHGVETIETVRVEKPDQYLKVVASILPKELNVKVSELDDLDDAELDRRIASLANALQLAIGTGQGARAEAEAPGSEPAGDVRAVH